MKGNGFTVDSKQYLTVGCSHILYTLDYTICPLGLCRNFALLKLNEFKLTSIPPSESSDNSRFSDNFRGKLKLINLLKIA